MISETLRRGARFLGSSVLATVLLAVVVVYSAAATFVPQGDAADPAVASWVEHQPALATVTRLLGMHHAFTSFVFLTCAALLVISAGVCSWRRTKVAVRRAGMLRRAPELDASALAESSTVRVSRDPDLNSAQVLSLTSEALEDLGIPNRCREDMLLAVSSSWTVWGSPVFHWALVAFVITMLAGSLQRSDGLMGLAVGETKPHTPPSYGFLDAGPLHDWNPIRRQVRLDRFEEEFVAGGIDRGPTPTVSLLDASGRVIKSQRVYPNSPLRSGPLTVHADDFGLAARIEILDAAGSPTERGTQYVDFDPNDPEGTQPLGGIVLRGEDGSAEARVLVTVPLDREDGQLAYWMPEDPSARLTVTSPDEQVIEERIVAPGQDVTLSTGHTLRLDSIDWYYRLSVVDDWTVPIVYTLLLVAFLGLTVSLVARQQIVVAADIDTPEGPVLAMKLHLWRNVPCEREEIEGRLAATLGSAGEASSHDA